MCTNYVRLNNWCICCRSVLSLVQFLFSFVLFVLIYDKIMNMKQKKLKIEPKIKLDYNTYSRQIMQNHIDLSESHKFKVFSQ